MTEEQLGKGVPFDRIRRITGYITGSLRTWGSAKQSELQDRVKHDVVKEDKEEWN